MSVDRCASVSVSVSVTGSEGLSAEGYDAGVCGSVVLNVSNCGTKLRDRCADVSD